MRYKTAFKVCMILLSAAVCFAENIDPDNSGRQYAWGENIGWINFDNADLFSSGVKVCVVNYLDLKTFAQQWLLTGSGYTADLYPDNKVDFKDFAVFADYWFDYCPDNWSL